MGENGEVSGLVKIFYGLLITLAVGTGVLAIISALVASGGLFDLAFTEILNLIIDAIKAKI